MKEAVASCMSNLRKRCTQALLLAGTMYLLAGIGCASCQRRLIYYPTVCTSKDAEDFARAEGLERWSSSSGKALGWKKLMTSQPAQGQVLVTHGNACCAFQCGHYAEVIQQTAPLDVYVVEYPGYGDSPGSPSEATLEQSAGEALQQLPTNSPVYLVGESLGTGVATYLAGAFPDRVKGVALLAPYNELTDVAQAHIRIFPVSWILCDRFPAEDYLRKYDGPVAVLVGGKDRVVPERFGRRLYDGYEGPKRLWEFPESNHNELMFQPAGVWKDILAFWKMSPG